MAEEKTAVEGQSDSGQDAGVAVEKKEEAVVEKVDYEAKYREIQAEKDRLMQEHEALTKEYETVKPYISFPAIGDNGMPAPSPTGNEDDELPVTRKELKQITSVLERRRLAERAADKFLGENPDLKPYEKLLVHFLGETKTLPEAAKKTRAFLEDERKKGQEEERKKSDEQKKAAAAASGLGSAGTTTPKKEEENVETSESYVERRKRQSQAKRVPV